jgi:vacuolar-type H+-ATPase subunit E/Vma4
MSENMSKSKEKMNLKAMMKKMIDEMSDGEMSKMLRESGEDRKFNLDLEENLRLKKGLSS